MCLVIRGGCGAAAMGRRQSEGRVEARGRGSVGTVLCEHRV